MKIRNKIPPAVKMNPSMVYFVHFPLAEEQNQQRRVIQPITAENEATVPRA